MENQKKQLQSNMWIYDIYNPISFGAFPKKSCIPIFSELRVPYDCPIHPPFRNGRCPVGVSHCWPRVPLRVAVPQPSNAILPVRPGWIHAVSGEGHVGPGATLPKKESLENRPCSIGNLHRFIMGGVVKICHVSFWGW